MRNENVTPSGTPAVTKPMKSGTAEQEQNGVATPKSAASTLPDAFAPPGQESPRALGREESPQDPDDEDDGGEQKEDLRSFEDEELDRRR